MPRSCFFAFIASDSRSWFWPLSASMLAPPPPAPIEVPTGSPGAKFTIMNVMSVMPNRVGIIAASRFVR
jgi:hypothetical protein